MSKFTSKKKKLKTMSKQINKHRKAIFSFKADAAGAVLWIGAMIGASAAFFIGRTLGREFAVSLIGDKLKKYDYVSKKGGLNDTGRTQGR